MTIAANPLLTFWRETTGLDPEREPFALNEYSRGLPAISSLTSLHEARLVAIARWAFAVPNEAALTALLQLGPLLDVGAGSGYWAGLLAARGADVRAYDSASGLTGYRQQVGQWFPVKRADAARAARHAGGRALVLVWPPYDDAMASRALAAYSGDTVAYVGEQDGGCTADNGFFAQIEAEWDCTADIAIPQWWGLHDALFVYRRKASALTQRGIRVRSDDDQTQSSSG